MAFAATPKLLHGGVLAGLGLLAWSAAEYVRVRRGDNPKSRWIARDLNRLDRTTRSQLRWRATVRADRLADVLAFGVAPAVCAWALRRRDESLWSVAQRDGFAVTEAAVVAGLLNQVAKQLAMRERPFADKASKRVPLDDRYGSFFSGHASSVAVVCAATAFRRVRQGAASKRLWVLPVLPLATAYLRIAADKHYATDVLAGLGTGVVVALLATWIDLGLPPGHRHIVPGPQPLLEPEPQY